MALSQEQIYNTSTASPQYESSVLKREERIIAFRLQNLKAEMTVLEHNGSGGGGGGGGGGGSGARNMRVHSRKIVFSLEQLTANTIKWAYRNRMQVGVKAIAIGAQTMMVNGTTGQLLGNFFNFLLFFFFPVALCQRLNANFFVGLFKQVVEIHPKKNGCSCYGAGYSTTTTRTKRVRVFFPSFPLPCCSI